MTRIARRKIIRTAGLPALCALLLAVAFSGCGTPGQPQPPSLKLPARVTDLAAIRAGSQVQLTWTMPKRDTDKVALKGPVTVTICRTEGAANAVTTCSKAGELSLAPAVKGTFTDSLPAALTAGPPRPLTYSVELKNRRGRSAGLSNSATVLAGQSPAPVAGFSAELHPAGVALHWDKNQTSSTDDKTQSIRLYRTLLNPQAKKKQDSGALGQPSEPTEQKLLIDTDSGAALDKTVNYDEAYEYRAQRIVRVELNGQALELAGEISAPVRIAFKDAFPPAVPQDLAAVATQASAATETTPATPAAIDLSWLPVTSRNLAGYIVYRSQDGADWQRISPAAPANGPAFHDATVLAGHTYRYAVSSVSLTGHESHRSAEAEESVPEP